MIALLAVYLAGGLVLLAGALVFAAGVRWGGPSLPGASDRFLRWGWISLALSLALPLLLMGGGWAPLRRPALEIWSGPAQPDGPARSGDERISLRLASGPVVRSDELSLGRGHLQLALAGLALGMVGLGGRLLWAQRRLRRFCEGLPVVKRVGRVVLAAGPEAGGPFAARAGGLAYVVVPTSTLADPRQLAMILAHEAHHLRQGHLQAARWLAGLQLLYFWNPALGLWRRALAELEDLACDQAVLARGRGGGAEYARCLLWAASRLTGTAGAAPAVAHPGTIIRWMASGEPRVRGPLARRMKMLHDGGIKTGSDSDGGSGRGGGSGGGGRTRVPVGWRAGLLGGACLTAVLGTALAVHATVGTPQVTAAEVAVIGARIQARSGFPVIADGRIAEALNGRLLQPAWRDRMRAGLARMPAHREVILASLKKANLPSELLAMVMSESAFDPEARTSRPPPQQSVGLWQLMPATARKFGLPVGPDRDDRLDVARSSDAAAQYLAQLYQRFGDWPVAISAYNGGEHLIERFRAGASIPETRDRLLASDREFGRYLTSVMISMLIIEDPTLID